MSVEILTSSLVDLPARVYLNWKREIKFVCKFDRTLVVFLSFKNLLCLACFIQEMPTAMPQKKYKVRIQSRVRHVRNKTIEIDDSVLVTFDVDTNSANMMDPTLYTYLVRRATCVLVCHFRNSLIVQF